MIFGTMGDFHGASTVYEKRVSRKMQDLWLEFARDAEEGLRHFDWGSCADRV
jgi:acetylcholinesterase